MTSPYANPYAGNQWYDPDFWDRMFQGSERRYQDTLGESRADRAARLTIANNQLSAERERNKIALGESQANAIYRQGQLALLRDELVLKGELGRGQLALDRERLGAETGLGLLNLRAGLKGPGDWAQYLDVGEGFSDAQPASGFLSTIAAGKQPGFLETSFGASPTRQTLAGLAAGPSQQQQQRLAADMQLANQIAGNVGKVAPGTFEGLGQDRMKYLLGLAATGGHSPDTILGAYDRAGIGQGSAFSY